MKQTLTSAQKKEWAFDLFCAGNHSQKEIALKVGVTEATMSRWVNAGAWEDMRTSLLTSGPEVLRTLYSALKELGKEMKETKGIGNSKIADMYVKYATAIEKLERETNAGSLIEAYQLLLNRLREHDYSVINIVSQHCDGIIKEKLKSF